MTRCLAYVFKAIFNTRARLVAKTSVSGNNLLFSSDVRCDYSSGIQIAASRSLRVNGFQGGAGA